MSTVFVTKGIVLRETLLRESDKLLTVLTGDFGKLTVHARGVRKKNGRFAAAAQPLVYSELKLFAYKDRYTLDEADIITQFSGLAADLSLLSLGAYFCALTELFADADAPSAALLSLLLNALYGLETLSRPQALVKAAFELRLLALSGYRPNVSACAVCGNPNPEFPMLHLTEGRLHCAACPLPGAFGASAPLCKDSLAALRYLLDCDSRRFLSFTLPEAALLRLAAAAEGYAIVQMDRELPTLHYYHSISQFQI